MKRWKYLLAVCLFMAFTTFSSYGCRASYGCPAEEMYEKNKNKPASNKRGKSRLF